MSRVAIIGCGFVGRAWAISFARAGSEVALWDADPSAPAYPPPVVVGVGFGGGWYGGPRGYWGGYHGGGPYWNNGHWH